MMKKSNEYGVKTDLHGRTLRVTTKPKPRMRARIAESWRAYRRHEGEYYKMEGMLLVT